jgi:DNA-binding protein YbaB
MGQHDGEGLDRSLRDAIGMLREVAGGQAPEQEVRGVGTAADESVRAEVDAFGRLAELSIDPSLLRQGTTAIARYVREAVRAAQDDARSTSSRLLAQASLLTSDDLPARLEQLTDEAMRGFHRVSADLDAALRRIEGRAGR